MISIKKISQKISGLAREALFFFDRKALKRGLNNLDEKLNSVFFYGGCGLFSYFNEKPAKTVSYYFKNNLKLIEILSGNFLIIDDMDINGGHLSLGFKNFPRLVKAESSPHYDEITVAHNGYKKTKERIVVSRQIVFDKEDDIIIIKDRADGTFSHNVKLVLRFHEGSKLKRLAEREEFELQTGNANVYIKIFSDDFDIKAGDNLSSPVIIAQKHTKLPSQIHTFINLKNKTFRESLLELDKKYMKDW